MTGFGVVLLGLESYCWTLGLTAGPGVLLLALGAVLLTTALVLVTHCF